MVQRASFDEVLLGYFSQLAESKWRPSVERFQEMLAAAGVELETSFSRTSLYRLYAELMPKEGKSWVGTLARQLTRSDQEALRRFFESTSLGMTLLDPAGAKVARSYLKDRELFPPQPEDKHYAGLYFVVHNSYAQPQHFAVHLMEVTYVDATSLSVVDRIIDNFDKNLERESNGSMRLIDGSLQILTVGFENRIGFSLFVSSEPKTETEKLKRRIDAIGVLSGLSIERIPFARHAMITRMRSSKNIENNSYDESRSVMHAMTGIYTKETFKKHKSNREFYNRVYYCVQKVSANDTRKKTSFD